MLIFGTQERQQPRGIVADRCAECGKITRLVVMAHVEVGHVYFVPIGEGRHRQTSMQCTVCGTNFVFNRNRYAEILPLEYGRACPMDDLIVRTNPALAEALGLFQAEDRRARCIGCGFERETPFRFCPRCGARAGEG